MAKRMSAGVFLFSCLEIIIGILVVFFWKIGHLRLPVSQGGVLNLTDMAVFIGGGFTLTAGLFTFLLRPLGRIMNTIGAGAFLIALLLGIFCAIIGTSSDCGKFLVIFSLYYVLAKISMISEHGIIFMKYIELISIVASILTLYLFLLRSTIRQFERKTEKG